MTSEISPPKRSRPQWWKREYLINPKFQWNLIAWFFVIFISAQILMAFGMFNVVGRFGRQFMSTDVIQQQLIVDFIEQQRSLLFWIFIEISIFLGAIMGIVGILISHRVAGPLHRLKIHLEAMTETGELKDLTFRKDDYFQELPGTFNAFIQSVESRRKDVRPSV